MITSSRFKKDTLLKQKVGTINVKECLMHNKGEEYIAEEKSVVNREGLFINSTKEPR